MADKLSEKVDENEQKNSDDNDSCNGAACAENAQNNQNLISFKVIYSKKRYDVKLSENKKILDLKMYLEKQTGVPPNMQKIMFKGLAKDEYTLKELKISSGSKLMLVGSTPADVKKIAEKPDQKRIDSITSSGIPEDQVDKPKVEPLSAQKMHKNILEKFGRPANQMIGISNAQDPLPQGGIRGMYTYHGKPVRLVIEYEKDLLRIQTNDRCSSYRMSQIRKMTAEPIVESPDYSIIGLQTGTTEASTVWIYWVPSQYVDALKRTLGVVHR